MADPCCLTCLRPEFVPGSGAKLDLLKHCPRALIDHTKLESQQVYIVACLAVGITARDELIAARDTQLASAKALNDRHRLALIRLRDKIDVAIGETAQCTEAATDEASPKPLSEHETASASASVEAPAASGGPSISSRRRKRASVDAPTSAEPAAQCAAPRLLSSGWLLESFDMGFRVGRQLSRDGIHIVLTINADSPKQALLPEAALKELLSETGVVLA